MSEFDQNATPTGLATDPEDSSTHVSKEARHHSRKFDNSARRSDSKGKSERHASKKKDDDTKRSRARTDDDDVGAETRPSRSKSGRSKSIGEKAKPKSPAADSAEPRSADPWLEGAQYGFYSRERILKGLEQNVETLHRFLPCFHRGSWLDKHAASGRCRRLCPLSPSTEVMRGSGVFLRDSHNGFYKLKDEKLSREAAFYTYVQKCHSVSRGMIGNEPKRFHSEWPLGTPCFDSTVSAPHLYNQSFQRNNSMALPKDQNLPGDNKGIDLEASSTTGTTRFSMGALRNVLSGARDIIAQNLSRSSSEVADDRWNKDVSSTTYEARPFPVWSEVLAGRLTLTQEFDAGSASYKGGLRAAQLASNELIPAFAGEESVFIETTPKGSVSFSTAPNPDGANPFTAWYGSLEKPRSHGKPIEQNCVAAASTSNNPEVPGNSQSAERPSPTNLGARRLSERNETILLLPTIKLGNISFGMKSPCMMDIKIGGHWIGRLPGEPGWLERQLCYPYTETVPRSQILRRYAECTAQIKESLPLDQARVTIQGLSPVEFGLPDSINLTPKQFSDAITSWRQQHKAKSTAQATLAYRVAGLVARTAGGQVTDFVDARQDESLDASMSESHVRRFFSSRPEVALSVLPKLLCIKEWLGGQAEFYFYGTSLLFAYDAAKHGDGSCDVRWINFSNAIHVSELLHDSGVYDLRWTDPETSKSVDQSPRQVNASAVSAIDRIINICRSIAWGDPSTA